MRLSVHGLILERLHINGVKNPLWFGGLDLPRYLSFFLHWIQVRFVVPRTKFHNPDSLQHCHVKYSLGINLRGYFPGLAMGPHAFIWEVSEDWVRL